MNPLEMEHHELVENEESVVVEDAREKRKHLIRAIVFGQLLSFIVALGALVTKLMVDYYKVAIPALQTAIGYLVIASLSCVLCGGITTFQNQPSKMIGSIALVAVADSQADFLGNLAYTFGVSIASVGMLSSFTIPSAMLLSYWFLQVRYSRTHFIGVGIALVGLVFVILADAMLVQRPSVPSNDNTTTGNGTSPSDLDFGTVAGDFLIIVGSALYAGSNVATESFVKTGGIFEFLFWLGTFGFMITIVQYAALEVNTGFKNATDVGMVWFMLFLHAICFFLIYFGAARYLKAFDSVLFNLNLLTTDVWGLLIGFFIFGEIIGALKILGFIAVVAGVVVYNLKPPVRPKSDSTPLKPRVDVEEADVNLIASSGQET